MTLLSPSQTAAHSHRYVRCSPSRRTTSGRRTVRNTSRAGHFRQVSEMPGRRGRLFAEGNPDHKGCPCRLSWPRLVQALLSAPTVGKGSGESGWHHRPGRDYLPLDFLCFPFLLARRLAVVTSNTLPTQFSGRSPMISKAASASLGVLAMIRLYLTGRSLPSLPLSLVNLSISTCSPQVAPDLGNRVLRDADEAP